MRDQGQEQLDGELLKKSKKGIDMKAKKVGKITWGQDGAIWGGYLFRFGSHGECVVYDFEEVKANGCTETQPYGSFTLDKAEMINPHSNSVAFGNEYYAQGDEFPLLYSNIYNNYAREENPLKGVTLVYRLQRTGNVFTSTLVQWIEVTFTENTELWKSVECADIRPYGNFAIDCEKDLYYAFTMRDQTQTTRYFAFDLPKLADGVADAELGVKKVMLAEGDIKEYFDCSYHRFIQGACLHGGKIYSVEGFSGDEKNKPALRVIDVRNKRQEHYVDFVEMDMPIEPEFIEFYQERCYYCDGHGNVYELIF